MTKNKWSLNIETKRLKLRPLNNGDADFVFAHFSNEDVCRYLFDEEPLGQPEEALDLIGFYHDFESKDNCRWALEHKESGKVIGTCGFHILDRKNNIIEMGYDLNKAYWGQGYMQEALEASIEQAFNSMSINRIQAFVYTGNPGSCRLLEKLHFQQEGIIREKHLFRGEYYDHYCYSLLSRDWNK